MPVFKLDIEKETSGEYWTNRYFIEAPDFAGTTAVSQAVLDIERSIHVTGINFLKVRVSDTSLNLGQFVTTSINLPGLRSGIVQPLPLFNTLRVDFSPGFTRPSRKYYRGVLGEEDISFDTINSASVSALGVLVTAFNSIPLVTETGVGLGTPTVFQKVQMRQLRRGSRRRQTPIIP